MAEHDAKIKNVHFKTCCIHEGQRSVEQRLMETFSGVETHFILWLGIQVALHYGKWLPRPVVREP